MAEACRRSERRARRRVKQNEVLVAEMQAIKKEKSIRVVNDCKMKNKMEWEQWQKRNKGDGTVSVS